jgi:D-arabinose 1-dehydrogenase-like Zn-dependent alcohol dehydrogenase
LILGHELSGRIACLGASVTDLAIGEAVSVDPRVGSAMLGIDVHGAFAEHVCIPRRNVVRLPARVPLERGVWVEPVASVLGALATGIRPDERGLVYGRGRIARLTHQVLVARGYSVDLAAEDAALESNAYRWAIETRATTSTAAALVAAVIPGGAIVLRSRTVKANAYGDFDEAARMLPTLDLDSLTGDAYPLDEWQAAFTAARASEERKILFAIGES